MSSATTWRRPAALISLCGLALSLLVAPAPVSASPAPEASTFASSVRTLDGHTTKLAKRDRWPSAANTGVPGWVELTPYKGPCTITRDNTVIDSKLVSCDLSIQAANVVITKSRINGTVWNDPESRGFSFKIRRSNIDAGEQVWSGVGSRNFTARRIEVVGGTRSVMCETQCRLIDSYLHGQMTDEKGKEHESGVRIGSHNQIIHNTITCDAPAVPPDAGCSAGLTGYGDFSVVEDDLIQGNLFLWSTGGTCAYGGSTRGKPYSEGVNDIRFIDNVFEKGPTGNCGISAATMDFDPDAPGDVWSGNRWRHATKKVVPWTV